MQDRIKQRRERSQSTERGGRSSAGDGSVKDDGIAPMPRAKKIGTAAKEITPGAGGPKVSYQAMYFDALRDLGEQRDSLEGAPGRGKPRSSKPSLVMRGDEDNGVARA